MRRHLFYASIVMCTLVLYIGAHSVSKKMGAHNAQAASFFSEALRGAHVHSTISWNGAHYTVANGVVYGDGVRVSENVELPVLQLAYEQALARRSPVFGLSGTDPSLLRDSVKALSYATEDVASAATSSADPLLIRTSLYPLSFLAALVDLEKARLRFITSGAQVDALVYRVALRHAVGAGQSDSKKFQVAMWRLFKDKHFIMYGLGGPISSEDLTRMSWNITLAMDATSNRIREREQCVKGDISACDARDLSIALPAIPTTSTRQPPTLPAQVEENRHLMARTTERPDDVKRPVVALHTSRCLGSLEAPYYVTARDRTGTGDSFFFLGELFFAKTAWSANALHRYLGETMGISYMPLNQFTFYMCPDTQDDSGRARAILAAAEHARSHPSSLHGRDALLGTSNVITEDAAIRYIHALVDDTLSKSDVATEENTRAVEELALMFQYKNAGINILVDEIVHTNATHAHYAQSGVPFDESARVMFMTHSGFLSLFLAHNILEPYTYNAFRSSGKSDMAALYRAITPYSSLTRCVSKERIVQDVRSFLLFEGIGPQAVNTLSERGNEPPEKVSHESTERVFSALGRVPLLEQVLPFVHELARPLLYLGNDRVR